MKYTVRFYDKISYRSSISDWFYPTKLYKKNKRQYFSVTTFIPTKSLHQIVFFNLKELRKMIMMHKTNLDPYRDDLVIITKYEI